MDPVAVLVKDHEKIEIELSELDFIIDGDEVNYPNLVHTFWKTCEIWNSHEMKEEEIFEVMKDENFEIPIDILLLEHESLRGRIEKITKAINSGSDFEVRKVLRVEMREFVDILRVHLKREEDALSGVLSDNFSEEGLDKIGVIVGKYA